MGVIFSSLLAGIMTGAGALLVIFVRHDSRKVISISLGFASGIMLGLSTLSLVPNSISTGNIYTCITGFVTGAVFLWGIDVFLPHVHKNETSEDAQRDKYKRMGVFIAIGIALHNLPEGIAIGVSDFISVKLGLLMAFSIGIHNIAEGLSIAVPLKFSGSRVSNIFLITVAAGLFTVIGAFISLYIVKLSPLVISACFAFAAGAMVYITSDELIPHSHAEHSEFANMGIIAGMVFALVLANL